MAQDLQTSKFNFLQSLDADADPALCDPEALIFKQQYNRKKQELTLKLFELYDEKVFNNQLRNTLAGENFMLKFPLLRCFFQYYEFILRKINKKIIWKKFAYGSFWYDVNMLCFFPFS